MVRINAAQLELPLDGQITRPKDTSRRPSSLRRQMKIRVHRCKKDDALYVRFSDTPVAETAEVRPGVMFDYDAEGRIVAMEILDASRTVAASDMQKLALEVA